MKKVFSGENCGREAAVYLGRAGKNRYFGWTGPLQKNCPTALLGRAAFAAYEALPEAKPRRRDGSAIPSISITEGRRPPSAVGAQNERTSFRMSFRFGGGGESRTPVRKPFHGNFSGRRRLLRESCSPCSRHPGQAVTPRGLVSFMIHGRRKALPAHVHH